MGICFSPYHRRLWIHLIDVLLNIVIIVGVVIGIRTFLVSPFQVEGSSMVSTLEDNEYIIINKLTYYLGKPQRGDVVVFHPPGNEDKYYVKRVIGLPEDEVILRDGYVSVRPKGKTEEVRLEEAYLDQRNLGKTFRHPPGSGNAAESRFAVPSENYFLLGDNRQGSFDSRSFHKDGKPEPFVATDAVAGRVWLIALPITKIHALEPPNYAF